jgi:hypothetical protein
MITGKWLEPRYKTKESFEKDYHNLNLSPTTVKCPGCGDYVSLNRKSNNQRLAGWCKKCSRAVTL